MIRAASLFLEIWSASGEFERTKELLLPVDKLVLLPDTSLGGTDA